MRKIISFFIFLLAGYTLSAQQGYADTSGLVASSPLKTFYDAQRGNESAIYNGTLYYSYSQQIDGIAFYQTSEWLKGDILFDNIVYNNIWMRYELVKDQVIVARDTASGIFMSLYSPRVKEFSYGGWQFVRLSLSEHPSSADGFYRVLEKGKLTVFLRASKVIDEKIDGLSIYRKFQEQVKYYAIKDNKFVSIDNKNDLLRLCKDHKKEVQQFIAKRKLKYRKNKETTIVEVAKFYNKL